MNETNAGLDNMTGQWFGQSYSNDFKVTTLIVVNIEPRSPLDALLIGVDYQYQRRTIAAATIEVKSNKFVGKTFNYQVYDHRVQSTIPLPVFYENSGIKEEPPKEAEYSGEFTISKPQKIYRVYFVWLSTTVFQRRYYSN